MKSIYTLFLTSIIAANLWAQGDVALGLTFANPDQLQGIPLASTPFSGTELPTQVDLSNKMPPVGDQGRQNSCVAWSLGYAIKSYHEIIEEGGNFSQNGQVNWSKVFSPAFIYNQINNGRDGGSTFIDGLNVLSNQGAVKWSEMPYNSTDFATKPNAAHQQKAAAYKIDYWRRVNIQDPKEVKAQLNAGFPVAVGAAIDAGFIEKGFQTGGRDYIWTAPSGAFKGGHAMVVVGYDDNRQAFKIMNSWGQRWGNNGFCWVSYNYFPIVVKEGYVAKDGINAPNPTNNPTTNPTNPQNPWVQPHNPNDFIQLNFVSNNVQYNYYDPNYGNGMLISGTVDIPARQGRTFQVVVHFYFQYYNQKGQPVTSAIPWVFSDVNGNAAAATQSQQLPPNGLRNHPWQVYIPYSALNVPQGYWNWGTYYPQQSNLYAEPSLFVDNYGVSFGSLIPFWVQK